MPPPVPPAPPAAAAPTAPAPQVAAVSDDAYPALPYSDFLANGDDEGRRQAFWVVFHAGEKEARTFALNRWIPVVRVQYTSAGAPGEWSANGVIGMKGTTDVGALLHELFHPVFAASEFHTAGDRDGAWSEAFCNVFRYYAETELMHEHPTKWQSSIDRVVAMTEEQALSGGEQWRKRKYVYPTSVIIKKMGPNQTLSVWRQHWFELLAMKRQAGGGAVLDQFFGYAPPMHKSDVPR